MVDFDGPVAATSCVKVRFREYCIAMLGGSAVAVLYDTGGSAVAVLYDTHTLAGGSAGVLEFHPGRHHFSVPPSLCHGGLAEGGG